MRFKDVFSIIGPAMVGPSSSHTAGAARLGRVARQLLGTLPEKADITFYGSFAETYLGHGTDLAVVGGLLNYDTDDLRIAQAMEHASSLGLEIEFKRGTGPVPHPNTAKIRCTSSRQTIEILGMSIGGGNIEIIEVDGFGVKFTAVYFTLVIWHTDRQGFIADATGMLNWENVNIGYMDTCRKARNGEAMTVIEVDNPCSPALQYQLSKLPGTLDVKSVNLLERSP